GSPIKAFGDDKLHSGRIISGKLLGYAAPWRPGQQGGKERSERRNQRRQQVGGGERSGLSGNDARAPGTDRLAGGKEESDRGKGGGRAGQAEIIPHGRCHDCRDGKYRQAVQYYGDGEPDRAGP